jgi:hypothetical protein
MRINPPTCNVCTKKQNFQPARLLTHFWFFFLPPASFPELEYFKQQPAESESKKCVIAKNSDLTRSSFFGRLSFLSLTEMVLRRA